MGNQIRHGKGNFKSIGDNVEVARLPKDALVEIEVVACK